MKQEIIKWIEGYEGLYQITSFGRVISVDRYDRFNRHWGGEIKQHRCGSRRDYWFVTLYKNGKGKQFYVHQLVARAFIPNSECKSCVDHIDNDKNNNSVDNLRWVTHLENMNNTITKKRMKDESAKYISQAGSDNPFSRMVAMYSLDGNFIKSFESAGQIEKEYGIRPASISRVCRGNRKQTHGYVFKYLTEPKRKLGGFRGTCNTNKPIVQLDKDLNIVAEYKSSQEAARILGIYACNISKVLNGKEKSYKGYKWRYK